MTNGTNCVHFKRFVGFSAESIAHQRWLEHLVDMKARAEKKRADAMEESECYKCGAKGHWSRNCPSAQATSECKYKDATEERCEGKEKPKEKNIIRRDLKPRVLLVPPPKRQRGVSEAFASSGCGAISKCADAS